MTNSEYRQPTHREELERELVHGASSQIAHAPENAAAIAKGIKTVLDELAPVAPHPAAIAPLPALDHGTDSLGREIQAKAIPAHQQRVLDEKSELDERLSKLDAFMFGNPLFLQLSGSEQERLARQSNAMAIYSGILGERIAAF